MGMGVQDVATRAGSGGVTLPDGPGDIVPFTVWWGLRAYNKSKCTGTTNAVRLRRVLDSVEATINITSTCDIDTAAATGHCAGTSCTAAIVYDQVAGNACAGASCNCVQTSAALQPAFVFNCIGAKPCLSSTTGTMLCASANNFTPSTGVTSLHYVGARAVGIGATLPLTLGGAGSRLSAPSAATWQVQAGAGLITRAATDAVWHVAAGVVNGASSSLSIDGGTTAGSTTNSVAAAAPAFTRGGPSTTQVSGEAGFINAVVLSAGQIASLNANARAWWGIP
jgi:hypothetical protein